MTLIQCIKDSIERAELSQAHAKIQKIGYTWEKLVGSTFKYLNHDV